nr:hypothetical protein CFP56_02927 [Quercus suber]
MPHVAASRTSNELKVRGWESKSAVSVIDAVQMHDPSSWAVHRSRRALAVAITVRSIAIICQHANSKRGAVHAITQIDACESFPERKAGSRSTTLVPLPRPRPEAVTWASVDGRDARLSDALDSPMYCTVGGQVSDGKGDFGVYVWCPVCARIRAVEAEETEEANGAMAAADRFVNYENEIRVLQAKLRQEQRRNAAPAKIETADLATPAPPGISRFGSFIGSRKPSANATVQSPKAREKELETLLAKEQASRISAEKRAAEVTAEIEELSVTLFQQANEMVARERKENAGLREKVAGLEGKATQSSDSSTLQKENLRLKEKLRTMEQRETERKRRLEKLEEDMVEWYRNRNYNHLLTRKKEIQSFPKAPHGHITTRRILSSATCPASRHVPGSVTCRVLKRLRDLAQYGLGLNCLADIAKLSAIGNMRDATGKRDDLASVDNIHASNQYWRLLWKSVCQKLVTDLERMLYGRLGVNLRSHETLAYCLFHDFDALRRSAVTRIFSR